MWPWRIAYPCLIYVPHSKFRLLVQRPTYFAGNAPSIGSQPQVILFYGLRIFPEDLCGWWWMQLFAWLGWAELPGEAAEESKSSRVIWTHRVPTLRLTLKTRKLFPSSLCLCFCWKGFNLPQMWLLQACYKIKAKAYVLLAISSCCHMENREWLFIGPTFSLLNRGTYKNIRNNNFVVSGPWQVMQKVTYSWKKMCLLPVLMSSSLKLRQLKSEPAKMHNNFPLSFVLKIFGRYLSILYLIMCHPRP